MKSTYENPELNDIDKKEFLKELFEMKTSTEEELILKKSKILEALKKNLKNSAFRRSRAIHPPFLCCGVPQPAKGKLTKLVLLTPYFYLLKASLRRLRYV